MKYKISIKDTLTSGPFAVYIKYSTDTEYVLFDGNVPVETLLSGIYVEPTVPLESVKISNIGTCCGNDIIIPFKDYLNNKPVPSPTPTPSTSIVIIDPNKCKLFRLINPWIESQDVIVTLCGATAPSKVFATALTPYFVCSSTYPIVPDGPDGTDASKVQVYVANETGCGTDAVTPTPTPTPTKTPVVTPTTTPGLTPSATPQPSPTSTSGLPLCSAVGRPPVLSSIITALDTQTGFQFDADGVTRFYVRIKQNGNLVRSTEMVYSLSATPADFALANASVATPVVQIFTTNTPVFKYAVLDSGTYTLEIEGSSCKSTPSVKTITITSTPLGFAAGYPNYVINGSTVTLSIKINRSATLATTVYNNTNSTQYYNSSYNYSNDNVLVIPNLPFGNYTLSVGTLTTNIPITEDNIAPKVMNSGLKEHMDIVWSGTSGNWIANDVSNVTVENGFELCYRIGGVVLRGSRLSNFVWQTNNPCRIVKCIINKTYASTYPWGKGESTDDNNAARSFSRNNSYAFSTTIFKS